MALGSSIYQGTAYVYPHKSPADAMRGDWQKVGADFRKAMTTATAEREGADEKEQTEAA
jgi:hypothetical protein